VCEQVRTADGDAARNADAVDSEAHWLMEGARIKDGQRVNE
jgi:hypothetical protein